MFPSAVEHTTSAEQKADAVKTQAAAAEEKAIAQAKLDHRRFVHFVHKV